MKPTMEQIIGGGLLASVLGLTVYRLLIARPRIKNIINELPKNGNYRNRQLEDITDITYHHTAGPDDQTTESIARYHVYNKDWPGIGYHFVIGKNGEIEQTNALSSTSYHNGYNNSNAVGIALKGNFELNEPTDLQKRSLVQLVKYLKRKLPNLKNLVGHNEYPGASTACPGTFSNIELIWGKTGLSSPYGPVSYGATLASLPPAAGEYNPQRADN